jgi:hypothetical protein
MQLFWVLGRHVLFGEGVIGVEFGESAVAFNSSGEVIE